MWRTRTIKTNGQEALLLSLGEIKRELGEKGGGEVRVPLKKKERMSMAQQEASGTTSPFAENSGGGGHLGGETVAESGREPPQR